MAAQLPAKNQAISGQQLGLIPSCNSSCVLLHSSLRLCSKVSSPVLPAQLHPFLFPTAEAASSCKYRSTQYGRITRITLQCKSIQEVELATLCEAGVPDFWIQPAGKREIFLRTTVGRENEVSGPLWHFLQPPDTSTSCPRPLSSLIAWEVAELIQTPKATQAFPVPSNAAPRVSHVSQPYLVTHRCLWKPSEPAYPARSPVSDQTPSFPYPNPLTSEMPFATT